MFFNTCINCNTSRLYLCDIMNVLNYLNNLWQHNDPFNNFLDIIWCLLVLNSGIHSLQQFRLWWHFNSLDYRLIDNNLPQNFLLHFPFNKLFILFDNLLNHLSKDLNFRLMMNFFSNFFNLIDYGSNWYISICLNLYWNLFIMNDVLGFWYFNDIGLLDDFRYVNWMQALVVLVDDFVHV